MDNLKLPDGCMSVEGPAELAQSLDALLLKCTAEPAYANEPHYFFYQLGNQKALIKVDMSERPFLFWYGDLLGRPATRAVKETIAKFLYEKCGEYELQFQDE